MSNQKMVDFKSVYVIYDDEVEEYLLEYDPENIQESSWDVTGYEGGMVPLREIAFWTKKKEAKEVAENIRFALPTKKPKVIKLNVALGAVLDDDY